MEKDKVGNLKVGDVYCHDPHEQRYVLTNKEYWADSLGKRNYERVSCSPFGSNAKGLSTNKTSVVYVVSRTEEEKVEQVGHVQYAYKSFVNPMDTEVAAYLTSQSVGGWELVSVDQNHYQEYHGAGTGNPSKCVQIVMSRYKHE